MNKYLKILALSTGILGAATPLAIDRDKDVKADLNKMYESVGKLDLFTNYNENGLSKIKYNLTINPTDSDVKFVRTTDEGEQELSNEQTISYLTENLNEVFTEYEDLKTCLSNAIKDTMDYLDECNNSEVELTNAQKLAIKERANTIKYLAETLEDLSEDVICCIDGCEEDENLDAVAGKYISAINSLEERIIALQDAINALQQPIGAPYRLYPNHVYGFRYNIYPDIDNELAQDNFNYDNNSTKQADNNGLDNNSANNQLNIGDISNNYSGDAGDSQDNANNNINNQDSNNTEYNQNDENTGNHKNNEDNNQELENNEDDNTTYNGKATDEDSSTNNTTELDTEDALIDDSALNISQDNAENGNADMQDVNDNIEDEKPTTFGLKSNIDTYGPGPYRNIDTFFNTALLDDQYGYGYNHGGYGGYGMPYGYGYPNGRGYYGGNMYGGSMSGYGYNSNAINRQALEQEVNAPVEVDTEENKNNDVDNSNQSKKTKDVYTPNKIKKNRAKNIDTYTQTTIQSNINTMGESKISKFFKEKFNNLRDKVRNRKQGAPELQKQIDESENELTENYQERLDEITNNELASPHNNSNSLLDNPNSQNNNTAQTSLINPEEKRLQEIEDLENATKDINNQINPDLDTEFKVEKVKQPDARE